MRRTLVSRCPGAWVLGWLSLRQRSIPAGRRGRLRARLTRWFYAGVAAVGLGQPAHAEEAPAPLTFNAALYSQYVFRGLTQTNGRAALQGGADYASPRGFYAGTWMSNVSWFDDANPGVSNPVEWDLYGGDRFGLPGGVGLDLGVIRFGYPGRYAPLPPGTVNPNMTELYVAASWKWACLKYSHAFTNTNGVQHSVGSSYLDLTLSVPVGSRLSVTLHGGRQTFRGHNPFTDSLGTDNDGLYTYTDYLAGITVTVGHGWSASVAYTRTTARDEGYYVDGRNLGGAHLAAGVTLTF